MTSTVVATTLMVYCLVLVAVVATATTRNLCAACLTFPGDCISWFPQKMCTFCVHADDIMGPLGCLASRQSAHAVAGQAPGEDGFPSLLRSRIFSMHGLCFHLLVHASHYRYIPRSLRLSTFLSPSILLAAKSLDIFTSSMFVPPINPQVRLTACRGWVRKLTRTGCKHTYIGTCSRTLMYPSTSSSKSTFGSKPP